MPRSDSTAMCYLVEWYQSGPAALPTADAVKHLERVARRRDISGQAVMLLMALAVPEDQTLFGVFRAAGVDDVIDFCRQAGWPADRISTGVQPWPLPLDI
jgi:hypothetical protein